VVSEFGRLEKSETRSTAAALKMAGQRGTTGPKPMETVSARQKFRKS
jgi:hypothetical protein